MPKIDSYSSKGTKGSVVNLPKTWTEKINVSLLAQALRVYEDGSHPGLAKTLTRSQIARTKKKWYRQKGTGGARHGARSAPLFVGGSKAHGPKGVKRRLTLPKKKAQKALKMALGQKIKDKKIVAVTSLDKISKTKEAQILIDKLAPKAKVLVALDTKNWPQARFFRNLKSVRVKLFNSLNAWDIDQSAFIVLDKEVIKK